MNERESIRTQVSVILGTIQYLIRVLYAARNEQVRYLALQDLWNQVSFLQVLLHLLDQAPPAVVAAPGQPQPLGRMSQPGQTLPPEQTQPPELLAITREELATKTGRNGNPAYVAVGGTVYDVTNHAGWSLGTHFGLLAGRDLTAEFNSCHAGQQWILPTLKPVGRLV